MTADAERITRMKNRPLRAFLFYLTATVGAGCYYLLAHCFSLSIPCIFRTVTGWLCPGCGITRMMLHLGSGDLAAAFGDNPVLFCLLPIFLFYMVAMTVRYLKGMSLTNKAMDLGVWIITGILIFWGILRNVLQLP